MLVCIWYSWRIAVWSIVCTYNDIQIVPKLIGRGSCWQYFLILSKSYINFFTKKKSERLYNNKITCLFLVVGITIHIPLRIYILINEILMSRVLTKIVNGSSCISSVWMLLLLLLHFSLLLCYRLLVSNRQYIVCKLAVYLHHEQLGLLCAWGTCPCFCIHVPHSRGRVPPSVWDTGQFWIRNSGTWASPLCTH